MPPLRINVFQHVPFEGLGSIETWAQGRRHRTAYTRLHAGDAPPQESEFDMLIVLGGPMGVHDEAAFPWLKAEKAAIEKALGKGKPVLGICLGAQLMADVLGGRVYQNRQKEIGWFPVKLEQAALQNWAGRIFPAAFTAFHWHGDTFELPEGAVSLARSEITLHQGFSLGKNALALQFHPEVTEASVEALIVHCGAELQPGPFVQTAEELRAGLLNAPELIAMMVAACGNLEAVACKS